ncbi:MAG: hypothetical protein JXA19_05415 [Anaerolineales bacterium]|nr:hypothetical protein [Anaerolineales bacterium]
MRTPAGKECKYFYGDYRRGRNHEECRLLLDYGLDWQPYLCEKCPLPSILMANSCDYMQYTPQLEKRFLIGKPQVKVSAYCTKSKTKVDEPRIGCGECHPLSDIFVVAPEEE